MRQASISSTLLKNIGLLIGLGFVVWGSSSAMAARKLPTMQEYCECTCGNTPIAVTPSTQPPNAANCVAMSGKTCKDKGKTDFVNCRGDTTVQRPPLAGESSPVAPVQPRVVQ